MIPHSQISWFAFIVDAGGRNAIENGELTS
jgi:hypothetical protein